MSELDNAIRPRQFAIVLIAEKRAELRERITQYDRHSNDEGDQYLSAARVYLERVSELLAEAAAYLRANAADDDNDDAIDL